MTSSLENLKVTLSSSELQVEPGQVAELAVSVKNLSEVVDQYQLEVEGIDPGWVEILIGSVSLFPHDEDSLRLALKPPRSPEARAGEHEFKLLIRSREFPEEVYSATLTLKVAAFRGFDARISPELLVVKGKGIFQLELANTGNCPLIFHLSAADNEQGCTLEFKPDTITIEPGQTDSVPLEAEPKSKPKIGAAKTYGVNVTVAPEGSEARTLACQVSFQPPIPKWVPVAAAAALVLGVVMVMSLLRSPPLIQTLKVSPETIRPGEPVTLTWEVTGASKVSITPKPGEGLKSKGEVELTPAETTVYKLVAKKGWSNPVEKQVKVVVNAELRQFEAVAGSAAGAQIEASRGEQVMLKWDVAGVSEVNISGLGTRPARGQEVVPAVATTDYMLKAEGAPLEGHVLVTVVEAPVIETFLPQPPSITRGNSAMLTWNVTGVDGVQISHLGSLPAAGSRAVRPKRTTNYVLTASNTAGTRQLSTTVEVTEPEGSVAAALAKKPVTEIPFIKKFEAYPTKVRVFEDTTLSWEVIGAERVVIEPGIGMVDNPDRGSVKKSFKIPGSETYVLTATNKLGKSTAKIKVDAVLIK